MKKYIAKRLWSLIPVMFVVATSVFFLVHLTPGDPASVLLGPDAPQEAIAELGARLGLDQPLPVQYVRWFGQVLQGNLGESIFLRRPVTQAIVERLAELKQLHRLSGAQAREDCVQGLDVVRTRRAARREQRMHLAREPLAAHHDALEVLLGLGLGPAGDSQAERYRKAEDDRRDEPDHGDRLDRLGERVRAEAAEQGRGAEAGAQRKARGEQDAAKWRAHAGCRFAVPDPVPARRAAAICRCRIGAAHDR